MKGNCTTQSDVVRAYTQSILNTQFPTRVELPIELAPKEFRGIKRPCVRLWKSLYGHPEAGYHWDQRFKQIMSEIGAVHCADTFQSTYYIKESRLLLTLYVDDILLSGPEENHQDCWKMLQKHTEIEDPTPVDRVLGRRHLITRDEKGASMKLDMSDFAANACTAYEELSGCVLKKATTPYLPEGSLVDSDFTVRGEMAQDASKVLMKILWSARLARPDLLKGISDLTRKITTWSRADDKRFHVILERYFRLHARRSHPR